MISIAIMLGFLSQDFSRVDSTRLSVLLEQLESPEISIRESSEAELEKLSEASLSQFQERLKFMPVGEASLRLKRVITRICDRKADRLLGEAKLDDALDTLAEGSHAEDSREYRKKRLLEVKAAVNSLLASDRISDSDIPYEIIARKVTFHGIWGLAVLLEMFRSSDDLFYHLESRRILRHLGRDAAPVFVAALGDPRSATRFAACSELEHLGLRSDLVVHALRKVYSDPKESPQVKTSASDALWALTDKRP